MDDRSSTSALARAPGPPTPPPLLGLQITVAVVLVGWALHATASVSALLVAAVFVAIVMAPLDRWVAEHTGQGWAGHVAALLVMIVVVAAFAAGLLYGAQRVATAFPALGDTPASMLPGIGEGGGSEGATSAGRGASPENAGPLGGALDGAGSAGGQLVSRLADLASTIALAALQFATAALGGVVLLIFLALIMLIDAPQWKARLGSVMGADRAASWQGVLALVARQLARFLMARAALGLLAAALYMLWLWTFGVDLILVWGVLTFLLSFVPNLGSILSGILPTIYAFTTKDIGTAIAVGAGLTLIEQVIGNYIDPRVQGRLVAVSPTVIFAGLLVFAWIWGAPGALLATPVLIAAVIAFTHLDAMRPVALLLSNCGNYEELDGTVRG